MKAVFLRHLHVSVCLSVRPVFPTHQDDHLPTRASSPVSYMGHSCAYACVCVYECVWAVAFPSPPESKLQSKPEYIVPHLFSFPIREWKLCMLGRTPILKCTNSCHFIFACNASIPQLFCPLNLLMTLT